MKEKEEKKQNPEEETSELNIEELMDVQGGIEDDFDDKKAHCGLGCYIGAASDESQQK